MTADGKKTIFISWSGDRAKAVATVLEEWLPLLFDDIKPWTSSGAIDPGNKWLYEINGHIQSSVFGIVIVTLENKEAPWLNFEAGAIGATFSGNDNYNRVAPIMVDFSSPREMPNTLSQYQSVELDRPGMLGVVKSIATVLGKEEQWIVARFDSQWNTQSALLEKAKTTASSSAHRTPDQKIDEILDSVRELKSSESDQVAKMRTRTISQAVMKYCAYHAVPYLGIYLVSEKSDTSRHIFVLDNAHTLTAESLDIIEGDLGIIAESKVTLIRHVDYTEISQPEGIFFTRERFEQNIRLELERVQARENDGLAVGEAS
ncbi:toll/interleukin-1 receptor domain-containing protein [Rhodococcoides yunnanense]|uniref:toll/interleukin-1 receptor domain-containing protein n=1 Tax=Rhodococcoides yunnanense TaxID=278209 RepID=UPI0009323794|nr:toll/interleukin-1 receptor domain-containing protein [Rhodococcus yunnanensis]